MDAFDFLHPTAASLLRDSALAPLVPAYWHHLTERRYAQSTARAYLSCLAHFARWIRRGRHSLDDLDYEISRFIDEHLPRCTCPPPAQHCRHQVRAAMRHLRVVLGNSATSEAAIGCDPIEAALPATTCTCSRPGAARSTCLQRLKIVGALLHMTAAVTPTADQLRRFIAKELDRVSPASGRNHCQRATSYLRFGRSRAIAWSICCRSMHRRRNGAWRRCRRRCRAPMSIGCSVPPPSGLPSRFDPMPSSMPRGPRVAYPRGQQSVVGRHRLAAGTLPSRRASHGAWT